MESTAIKNHNGSAVPAVQSKGTTSANNSESSDEIKVCTRLEDDCNCHKGYTCTASIPCTENGRPWICRGCDKAPVSCGKSSGQCEMALWKANEYERGHA